MERAPVTSVLSGRRCRSRSSYTRGRDRSPWRERSDGLGAPAEGSATRRRPDRPGLIDSAVANVEWAVDRIAAGDYPMRPSLEKCAHCDLARLCRKEHEGLRINHRPPAVAVSGGTERARAFRDADARQLTRKSPRPSYCASVDRESDRIRGGRSERTPFEPIWDSGGAKVPVRDLLGAHDALDAVIKVYESGDTPNSP